MKGRFISRYIARRKKWGREHFDGRGYFVRCPDCGRKIRKASGMCANGPYAGDQYTCPKCNLMFQVPWDNRMKPFVSILVTAAMRGQLKR
jgi:predicted RNA-binding Zn-ribbon protein involved in translation (DUF1610 family)